MKGISGLAGVALLALVITSCGGSDSTSPGGGGGGGGGGDGSCPSNTICMGSSTFFPTSITVPVGTSVDFTNNSGVTHNVIFDNASIGNIGDHSSGTSSRVFTAAGTYPFHCSIHAPGMKGSIVVQ